MSVYFYCLQKSPGVTELIEALGATRLRRFDGLDFWDKHRRVELKENDSIVCWSTGLPELEGIKVLNPTRRKLTKYEELYNLAINGIVVVRIYSSPLHGIPGILARSNHHKGADDLLNPPKNPDYWTTKEDISGEYRLHSFGGRSIKAGVKKVREGFTIAESEVAYKKGIAEGKLLAHPWIRSTKTGWFVDYENFTSTAKMKQIAHKSIEILGLTFGAVDIGERTADGTLFVMGVSRAPEIEAKSMGAYQRAITKWLEGETEEKEHAIPVTLEEDLF